MKRALYTLANEEFGFFVNKLTEEFKKRKVPHIFVGGTAVQAYLLKKLNDKTGKETMSLVEDPSVRLQDYIRATDDIDLALKFPKDGKDDIRSAKEIYSILDSVADEYISDTGNYIFKYDLERRGVKRPVFKVSVMDSDIELITLNISKKPSDLKGLDNKFYNEFMENGEELIIPHFENFNLYVRVPRLEHVLATKISNFRAKDIMDVKNLVDITRSLGQKIDMKEIERILLPKYTKKYEKFQAVINGNH